MRNAEVVGLFHRAQEFGITVAEWSADYAQAVQRSRRVADRMAKGVEFLFRKNKITLYAGVGVLTGRNTVEVKGEDGTQTLEGKAIILATGSEPKSLPGVALDEKQVISSNGAVRSEVRPGSLIVIGAGAVGMEFADVFAVVRHHGDGARGPAQGPAASRTTKCRRSSRASSPVAASPSARASGSRP